MESESEHQVSERLEINPIATVNRVSIEISGTREYDLRSQQRGARSQVEVLVRPDHPEKIFAVPRNFIRIRLSGAHRASLVAGHEWIRRHFMLRGEGQSQPPCPLLKEFFVVAGVFSIGLRHEPSGKVQLFARVYEGGEIAEAHFADADAVMNSLTAVARFL